LAAGLADNVTTRTEALAQVGQELPDVGLAGVDAEEVEGVGHEAAGSGVYLGRCRFYGHTASDQVQIMGFILIGVSAVGKGRGSMKNDEIRMTNE
jgi:hypothetical protein